jgi:hypothetical protein
VWLVEDSAHEATASPRAVRLRNQAQGGYLRLAGSPPQLSLIPGDDAEPLDPSTRFLLTDEGPYKRIEHSAGSSNLGTELGTGALVLGAATTPSSGRWQWSLEWPSAVTYYQITNQWYEKRCLIDAGLQAGLEFGCGEDEPQTHWQRLPTQEGRIRFRHRLSGDYLYVDEAAQGLLASRPPLAAQAAALDWSAEPVQDGAVVLRNRATDKLIHREHDQVMNNLLRPEVDGEHVLWVSAWWKITEVQPKPIP